MKLRKNKTKMMIVGEQEALNIDIEVTRIEQVNTFHYLGVTIDGKATQDK